jgi:hypothetical protein
MCQACPKMDSFIWSRLEIDKNYFVSEFIYLEQKKPDMNKIWGSRAIKFNFSFKF